MTDQTLLEAAVQQHKQQQQQNWSDISIDIYGNLTPQVAAQPAVSAAQLLTSFVRTSTSSCMPL